MRTNMKRSKIYSYSYALGQRRKSGLRRLALWLLCFLPVFLLLVELTLRFTGSWLGLEQVKGDRLAHAYSLSPHTNGISLQIQRHGSLGYVLSPQRGLHWQINSQGFRSDSAIPTQSAQGETRLFLLGNSTAFGYGAESNQQTLAVGLEKILNDRVTQEQQKLANQPPIDEFDLNPAPRFRPTIKNTKFRVITAAVPGYASGNQLSLLAHRILDLHPDGMILLGGYEDLRLPSSQAIAEIAPIDHILDDPTAYARQQLGTMLGQWFNSLYLARLTRKILGLSPTLPPTLSSYQTFDSQGFSTDPAEIQARVQRLQENWQKIAQLAKAQDTPMVLALQPEVTANGQQVQRLTELDQGYVDRIVQNIPYWQKLRLNPLPPQARLVDLSSLFRDLSDRAFSDPIHLTEVGNQSLVQALADQVGRLFPPEIKKSE